LFARYSAKDMVGATPIVMLIDIKVNLFKVAFRVLCQETLQAIRHRQSADTVRLPAHSRSAATFSAITTANGRVFCISRAIIAALTG